MSLCSMFLIEAAKKADTEFGVTLRSTKHTVRDTSGDVRKMAMHLMEHTVTVQATGRTRHHSKMSQKMVSRRCPNVGSNRS